MRTLAIGDIHGCSMHLDRLLAAVQPGPEDTLIFLGDYVDRGPDSRGVIERLMKLKETHTCVFLKGNHEVMMLAARDDKGELKNWLSVGGVQTLGSYGARPGRSGGFGDVPKEHWKFLENDLRSYYETPAHIFVHASLEPETPLDEQGDLYLFWEFLSGPVAHNSGKTMICGHTSQKGGAILDYGTAICIDTHAYGGGRLTCLCVETLDYWQTDLLGRTTTGFLTPSPR